ncbi:MAG: hypothetical protein D6674_05970 [Acidobacteria bacterium]|jgi:hypothetical protein|nr:MAG: hypothetical protein D6674_05970 [Acidobacteriota bacterium]
MKAWVVLTIAILTYGCASVVNTQRGTVPSKDSKFIVLPFENYTETPLAGLRIGSMVYGVMVSKGYKAELAKIQQDKDYKPEEIEQIAEGAKRAGYDYAVMGSVNEFRYKTGIDGEPAVSITLKVYELKSDRVIYSAVGSRTGWSHESLGTVAQKILNNILP